MMMWSIELLEYDIAYKPRDTIKAQVLDDFINKFHPSLPFPFSPLKHNFVCYFSRPHAKRDCAE